jgi:glycosyltransferase involved in cell wall biosynthesis
MNILHVTLGFYPATAWGGPVKTVHQAGKELVRRGHKVTVYCTNLFNKKRKIKPYTFENTIDGLRVVYFDTWHIPWWPGTLGPIWLPKLSSFLARELPEVDVIHLNGYRNLMFLPIVDAARKLAKPIVTQPHGAIPVIVNSFTIKRLYDRLFGNTELDGVSTLIALQESERQQALARGISDECIKIIPNGLDLTERDQLPEPGYFRRRFGLDSDRPLILFLGRINRKKGADMLVEAFAQLNGVEAQLAIVGPDDGQLMEVQRLIQTHNLTDRVILPGLLSGQDVMAAFQDADLFVLPCRADTFPVTIMEACLAGTPMVITNRCEIAHLVEGRIADVVPFDTDKFAAAMITLLTDQSRYNQYRNNCPAVLADTFSIGAVVDQLENVYNQAIKEKQSKRCGKGITQC